MNEMTFANSNLSGEFDFTWAATRGGDNADIGESKIKLPTMFTIPLPIGGIPEGQLSGMRYRHIAGCVRRVLAPFTSAAAAGLSTS
jgi:hypothetical protein